ncbi:platelet endothelial aggregation receptor 1-like [Hydractinia symbiolongicarpus]|uniref:platelet endothelial aggregation receptor 1-like n=1 Tax=Hydractinia symbiolongicarpus TaxID=13093 RepID=UPI0025505A7E|nr:platelet endothelial aggregation receptor 1-like [Hydractinia symbiolongicarpus]
MMSITYILIAFLYIGFIHNGAALCDANTGCTSINDCQFTPGQAFACLSSGKCLCNPGWTGPNAIYLNINTPVHGIRLVADNCKTPCNTVGQPPTCASQQQSNGFCGEPSPEDQLRKDGLLPPDPAKECNSRCTLYGAGKCSTTVPGACECYYGWTGPNSCFYDMLGVNRILATHCNQPCHYTHDYRNSACLM